MTCTEKGKKCTEHTINVKDAAYGYVHKIWNIKTPRFPRLAYMLEKQKCVVDVCVFVYLGTSS